MCLSSAAGGGNGAGRPAAAFRREPAIGWRGAHAVGARLMAAALARHGLHALRENALNYDPQSAAFSYSVSAAARTGPADAAGRDLTVVFDAAIGALRSTSLQPEARLGDVITDWLNALHIAAVWGLPYRVVVCITGLVVAMIAVTGVYIRWKKRAARRLRGRSRFSAARSPPPSSPLPAPRHRTARR